MDELARKFFLPKFFILSTHARTIFAAALPGSLLDPACLSLVSTRSVL